jgi:mycofactocin system glycosyltransferase
MRETVAKWVRAASPADLQCLDDLAEVRDATERVRPGGYLWLEEAPEKRLRSVVDAHGLSRVPAPEGVLLRRLPPARYRLAEGLEVHDEGRLLVSARPAAVFRMRRAGDADLILALARAREGEAPRSSEALAETLHLPWPAVSTTLARLEDRRLVDVDRTPSPHRPPVTAIVPAFGRPEAVRRCVASLLAQRDVGPLEILVVDDASPTPLAEALADLEVRVLRHDANAGPSAARNTGARAATHEVLAFLDSDCEAAPRWLATLLATLDAPRVDAVAGRVRPAEDPQLWARYEQSRSSLDMGPRSGWVGDGGPSYVPSTNLVVRRDAHRGLGGFREGMHLGEDVDYVFRLLREGGRVAYEASTEVRHRVRDGLGAQLRRVADYASSEAPLQLLHPQRARREMHVPRTALLGLAAVAAAGWKGWLVLGLLGALVLRVTGELRDKRLALAKHGVERSGFALLPAVLRSHRAALVHLGSAVGRYYGLPLALAALLHPSLALLALLLLLPPPVEAWWRLRPPLPLPTFVGLYALEMIAYQAGLVVGCWREGTLRPLWPRVVLRR